MGEFAAADCSCSRDVKEEPSPKARKLDQFPMPKCAKHSSADCKFWCDDCNIAVCIQCADVHHEKHSLHMLRHVIKDKISESLRVLRQLKRYAENVEDGKSQCNQEIAVCSKLIHSAESGKIKCEKVQRLIKSFDSHLPSLKEIA